MGPRPPPLPDGIEATGANLDWWARTHADAAVGIATCMAWGEPASAAAARMARQTWSASEAVPTDWPVDGLFRFIRELGETPDTLAGVATLLRLADLIRTRNL